MLRRVGPLGCATVLVAGVIAVGSCPALLREGRRPLPAGNPTACPWGLDRRLLLPEATARITILVEVVRGRDPRPEALDRLVEIAARYGERPASWTRIGSEGAPKVHVAPDREPVWDEPPDPTTSFVFVLYVGSAHGWYAQTDWMSSSHASPEEHFPRILVAQENIDRFTSFFGSTGFEGRTLVHEYGHVLGLSANPSHSTWSGGGGHCVHPDCVVGPPTFRRLAYRFCRSILTLRSFRLDDFCADCGRDIEAAKAMWRSNPLPVPGV